MEQTCQNDDFGLKAEEILKKKIDNAIKSNKCNQCDFVSNVKKKIDNAIKSNKCNQCDYASCRQFEDSFENAQWRKVKQMQPM